MLVNEAQQPHTVTKTEQRWECVCVCVCADMMQNLRRGFGFSHVATSEMQSSLFPSIRLVALAIHTNYRQGILRPAARTSSCRQHLRANLQNLPLNRHTHSYTQGLWRDSHPNHFKCPCASSSQCTMQDCLWCWIANWKTFKKLKLSRKKHIMHKHCMLKAELNT